MRMSELDLEIYDDLNNELYKRGYGRERLGSLNESNEMLLLLIVAAVLYMVWK